MKQVRNKITEYIALFSLMQPLGKARIILLSIEVFMIIMLAGYGLGYASILYVMTAVLASVFYTVVVIVDTFK